MASAFLNSTPIVAPLPVATMIDMGVARPRAQGQAMMRTATALTRAWASLGSGPTRAHTTNVMTAVPTTAGTKYPATLSASLLDRRAAALRLRHHRDDARKQRVGTDLLCAHDEGAGAVDRGADDRVARPFVDGHRLAGDHRLVDCALPLEHRAVHRHLLAGPHAQPVADLHRVERHVLFGAVVAQATRGLGREAEQLPDGGAGLAAGAQLEHLAEQDQRDDHRRGLEVHRHVAGRVAERRGKTPGARAATTL